MEKTDNKDSKDLDLPKKEYFTMYEKFRKSRLFREIYDGKSVGETMVIE